MLAGHFRFDNMSPMLVVLWMIDKCAHVIDVRVTQLLQSQLYSYYSISALFFSTQSRRDFLQVVPVRGRLHTIT